MIMASWHQPTTGSIMATIVSHNFSLPPMSCLIKHCDAKHQVVIGILDFRKVFDTMPYRKAFWPSCTSRLCEINSDCTTPCRSPPACCLWCSEQVKLRVFPGYVGCTAGHSTRTAAVSAAHKWSAISRGPRNFSEAFYWWRRKLRDHWWHWRPSHATTRPHCAWVMGQILGYSLHYFQVLHDADRTW